MVVIEYWIIFLLEIHLNQKNKNIGEFGHIPSIVGMPYASGI
jgi:hypothetical protein